ncbi:MAG: AAA family ATPase [Saprospiraceae bacterium]
MRITSLNIQNFKRFTNLTIDEIPESAKLVLLIGANGSGKSSVFDAFDFIAKGHLKHSSTQEYYSKNTFTPPSLSINFSDGSNFKKEGWAVLTASGKEIPPKFFGRSSIRIVPQILNQANRDAIISDSDSPQTYIQNDTRFLNDVFAFIQEINRALREPVFSGKTADTLQIFRDFIEPLNVSLLKIFGGDEQTTIQIAEFQDATPNSAPKLIFRKGQSKINYDFLSHGEKQVIILLLNFIVRQEQYRDSIIFIDEMDCHLNTSLQSRLLGEIVERWVPEDAQLWTASHALGFIEYAKESERSAILDFDLLDFDKPQVIRPSDKTHYEIFEIAVSKEFIDKVFQGRKVVFAENTDTPLYNNLSLENTFFFIANDKLDVFQKAKNLNKVGLIDRDYLLDEEVAALRETYPWLRVLPYYSIENLLYHPNNLAEYYAEKALRFDKASYTAAITSEKNNKREDLIFGLAKARDGYPFFKEINHAKRLKNFRDDTRKIIELLKSDDFETFYSVFPAKDYGRNLSERQNLDRLQLAKTKWFRQQIVESIQ